MSTATNPKGFHRNSLQAYPRFERIQITSDRIIAELSDERIVSVPLWWSWRLEQATLEQRANYVVIGAGHTAYWAQVDEHLNVQGFLEGTPAPRPASAKTQTTVVAA